MFLREGCMLRCSGQRVVVQTEIMRREKVAENRTMRGDDMKKLALDLEIALYESEPGELNKIVERMLRTVAKVEFIKK